MERQLLIRIAQLTITNRDLLHCQFHQLLDGIFAGFRAVWFWKVSESVRVNEQIDTRILHHQSRDIDVPFESRNNLQANLDGFSPEQRRLAGRFGAPKNEGCDL